MSPSKNVGNGIASTQKASNRVGNRISVGNGLPIALEMELRPRNGLPTALEMELRPRNGLPTALEMEFPSEMGFQSRWKWNCVRAIPFPTFFKLSFRQANILQHMKNPRFRRTWGHPFTNKTYCGRFASALLYSID